MTYSITFSIKASKQFKKLDKDIQNRIRNSLRRIRIRPHTYLTKIVNSPYHRLRVGNYRVILRIVNNELTIIIIKAGHRKNIYKT